MSELLTMFQIEPGRQWWHFVVRAVIVYVFLLAIVGSSASSKARRRS